MLNADILLWYHGFGAYLTHSILILWYLFKELVKEFAHITRCIAVIFQWILSLFLLFICFVEKAAQRLILLVLLGLPILHDFFHGAQQLKCWRFHYAVSRFGWCNRVNALVALLRHFSWVVKRWLLGAQRWHHNFVHLLGNAGCIWVNHLAFERRRSFVKTDIVDLRRLLLIRL